MKFYKEKELKGLKFTFDSLEITGIAKDSSKEEKSELLNKEKNKSKVSSFFNTNSFEFKENYIPHNKIN